MAVSVEARVRIRGRAKIVLHVPYENFLFLETLETFSKYAANHNPPPFIICLPVQMLRQRKEESILRGAIEKERKEVEGCTFKPNISLCPAYIAVRS